MNRVLTVLTAIVAIVVSPSVASAATSTPEGSLAELPGTSGCLAETGLGGECQAATGIDLLFDTVISPDGKHLYAFGRETIGAYARAADGSLTQLGCWSATGTFGRCTPVYGLDAGSTNNGIGGRLFISPDGRNLYAWNVVGERLLTFDRRADGTLSQASGQSKCVADGDFGGECINVPLLSTAWDFDLTPDGRHIYVASYFNDAVAILRRDHQTGLLSQSVVNEERCISPIRPECKPVSDVRIQGPIAVDVSPDGRFVYIASVGQDPTGRDVVASFARNSENGELTPVTGPGGCISASGSGGQCVGSPLGNSLRDLVISPDGRTLYLSEQRGSVVVDPANGTMSEGIVGLDGPVLGGGTWSGADSSFSPGGRFLYSLGRAYAIDPSGAIADLTPGTPADYYDYLSFPGDSEVSPDGRNVYVVVRHGDYGKSVLQVMNVAPAEVGLGKLKRRPNGSARLAVTVPDAGTLALAKTKLVKAAQVSAAGPQTVQLKVAPGAKARRQLDNNGRARVNLRLNFTTATGQRTETATRVKLTRGR